MKTITIKACADRVNPCPHFRSSPLWQCVKNPQQPVDLNYHVAVAEIDARCTLPDDEAEAKE